MAASDRKEQILDYLRGHNRFVTVGQLCGALYVSSATIRRDLAELERGHLVRRTRGGAFLVEGSGNEDPVDLREGRNVLQKQIIAGLAVGHVEEGMTLFMDSSSTVAALARLLDRFSNLRVVTNGLKTAWILSEYPGVQVMCTGGTLRPNSKSFVGQPAMDFAARLNADVAFMSCRGFSLASGASEASEDEYYLKRQYLEHSKKSVLLCDSSKMDLDYIYRIAPLDRFAEVITERKTINGELARVGVSR